MIFHVDISDEQTHQLIKSGQARFTGHKRLKIYCFLDCRSGERMLRENRVFFKDETEAKTRGFRPCGHCMRDKYLVWKENAAKA